MDWVRMSDKKPEKDGGYFVYAQSLDPDQPLFIHAFWDDVKGKWIGIADVWAEAITHWMNPAEPKDVVGARFAFISNFLDSPETRNLAWKIATEDGEELETLACGVTVRMYERRGNLEIHAYGKNGSGVHAIAIHPDNALYAKAMGLWKRIRPKKE
jgi:hypothetical protein